MISIGLWDFNVYNEMQKMSDLLAGTMWTVEVASAFPRPAGAIVWAAHHSSGQMGHCSSQDLDILDRFLKFMDCVQELSIFTWNCLL